MLSLRKVCDNCGSVDDKKIPRWYSVEVKSHNILGSNRQEAEWKADYCSINCALEGIKKIDACYKKM